MRIHIMGACGTFMAGIALLAKQAGHDVSGSDQHIYPPMSTQLAAAGIAVTSYDEKNITNEIDQVIVGNVMKRGNPELEKVLNQKIAYASGPQWLYETILSNRTVLAVAGTHGKTTTTAMLAWVLEHQKKNPSFLVGGIPIDFNVSVRLTDSDYFVIEADEYDTAFFDKRSKFVHYHPDILILNNLEFDHADIFSSLSDIQKQFHHLVRIVPSKGHIVSNATSPALKEVLKQGCWTPVGLFNAVDGWQCGDVSGDGSEFDVLYQGEKVGRVRWSLIGEHNRQNALAVIAAAKAIGILPSDAIAALNVFKGVKRRMEKRGVVNGMTIYDDFAHHPTAIELTLNGLRRRVGKERIIAVVELGSYTMRSGVHDPKWLAKSLETADIVFIKYPAHTNLSDQSLCSLLSQTAFAFTNTDELLTQLHQTGQDGDHVLVMSNTGFDGIFDRLI